MAWDWSCDDLLFSIFERRGLDAHSSRQRLKLPRQDEHVVGDLWIVPQPFDVIRCQRHEECLGALQLHLDGLGSGVVEGLKHVHVGFPLLGDLLSLLTLIQFVDDFCGGLPLGLCQAHQLVLALPH
jgi:hypothetical protein